LFYLVFILQIFLFSWDNLVFCVFVLSLCAYSACFLLFILQILPFIWNILVFCVIVWLYLILSVRCVGISFPFPRFV
jgi:hypothetical protein